MNISIIPLCVPIPLISFSCLLEGNNSEENTNNVPLLFAINTVIFLNGKSLHKIMYITHNIQQ